MSGCGGAVTSTWCMLRAQEATEEHLHRVHPLVAEDIITGERLQALADITIVTEGWLNFHASLRNVINASHHAIVIIDDDGHIIGDSNLRMTSMRSIESARVIFVYTHLLKPFFLGEVFAASRKPFVLITHNGDDHVSAAIAPIYEDKEGEQEREGQMQKEAALPGQMAMRCRRQQGGREQGRACESMRESKSGSVQAQHWELVANSALHSGNVSSLGAPQPFLQPSSFLCFLFYLNHPIGPPNLRSIARLQPGVDIFPFLPLTVGSCVLMMPRRAYFALVGAK